MPLLHSVSHIPAIPGFVKHPPCIGAVLASTPLPREVLPLTVAWEQQHIPVGLLQQRDSGYPSAARETFIELVKTLIKSEVQETRH